MNKVMVMVVGANPDLTADTNANEEFDAIQDVLGRFKASFELAPPYFQISARDLISRINEHQPNVIHFIGHGTENEELLFTEKKTVEVHAEGKPAQVKRENRKEPVDAAMVAEIFSLAAPELRLVVLSACYSDSQAQAIAQYVDCVIGVRNLIYNTYAPEFSRIFYKVLAVGRTLDRAVKSAEAALKIKRDIDQPRPEIVVKEREKGTASHLRLCSQDGGVVEGAAAVIERHSRSILEQSQLTTDGQRLQDRPIAGLAIEPETTSVLTERLFTVYAYAFVGRSNEIRQIRTLLQVKKPGYHLVQEPGGSGKTALLINLVHQLNQTSTDPRSPFLLSHFIRLDQTDQRRLLQSLITQILDLLQQEEPIEAEVFELQRQFLKLWSRLLTEAERTNRPVLLILDGLDELPDPASLKDWLPGRLGPSVHVVLGLRTGFNLADYLPQQEHIARWATVVVKLHEFAEDEIVQLLSQVLEDPERAKKLAPQVMALTKGFPLRVRLLARDLVERGDEALNHEMLSERIEDYVGYEANHLAGC